MNEIMALFTTRILPGPWMKLYEERMSRTTRSCVLGQLERKTSVKARGFSMMLGVSTEARRNG